MRYWVGLILTAGAFWFFYSALAYRRRALAAREAAAARGDLDEGEGLHPSLAILRDILPGLVIFFLVIVGLKIVFAYWLIDGGRYFSLFDLAGLLLLMVGYGTWIVLRSKFSDATRLAGRTRSDY